MGATAALPSQKLAMLTSPPTSSTIFVVRLGAKTLLEAPNPSPTSTYDHLVEYCRTFDSLRYITQGWACPTIGKQFIADPPLKKTKHYRRGDVP